MRSVHNPDTYSNFRPIAFITRRPCALLLPFVFLFALLLLVWLKTSFCCTYNPQITQSSPLCTNQSRSYEIWSAWRSSARAKHERTKMGKRETAHYYFSSQQERGPPQRRVSQETDTYFDPGPGRFLTIPGLCLGRVCGSPCSMPDAREKTAAS